MSHKQSVLIMMSASVGLLLGATLAIMPTEINLLSEDRDVALETSVSVTTTGAMQYDNTSIIVPTSDDQVSVGIITFEGGGK